MPAAALGLKKYLRGIEFRISTCDNEHTLAPLGQAEILSVEHSPRCAAPGSSNQTRTGPFLSSAWNEGGVCAHHGCEDVSERIVAGSEDARDIFPENDGSPQAARAPKIVNCIGNSHEFEREDPPAVCE
jgi:hypothetical protein